MFASDLPSVATADPQTEERQQQERKGDTAARASAAAAKLARVLAREGIAAAYIGHAGPTFEASAGTTAEAVSVGGDTP